jgi:hypothetical protein
VIFRTKKLWDREQLESGLRSHIELFLSQMAAVQMDVRFVRSSKLRPEVNVSNKVER